MLFLSKKQDWLGNIRGDVLAGLVVALGQGARPAIFTGGNAADDHQKASAFAALSRATQGAVADDCMRCVTAIKVKPKWSTRLALY